jgi:hypothetical protein
MTETVRIIREQLELLDAEKMMHAKPWLPKSNYEEIVCRKPNSCIQNKAFESVTETCVRYELPTHKRDGGVWCGETANAILPRRP